jgi:hypothetical protein
VILLVTVWLSSTGTQNVSDNKIIGTFAKGGSATASTATLYISAGVHSAGSIVNHLNNFSITVTLNTIIAGWSITVLETPPKLSPEILLAIGLVVAAVTG